MSYVEYFQTKNPLSKLRSKVSHRARVKMYSKFVDLVNPTEASKILDMGVSPDHLSPEANFFEKLYPYVHNITMSSVEDAKNLEQVFPGSTFVQYRGEGRFPFEDKQFDICFSSAVLEHVGNSEKQACFIAECIRVSNKVYLTTPNKYFPVEMHTMLPLIHLLPQHIHQSFLRLLRMEHWSKTENLNLLTAKKLLSLVPASHQKSANIYYHRLLGFRSNLILVVES